MIQQQIGYEVKGVRMQRMKWKVRAGWALAAFVLCGTALSAQNLEPWEIGPFVRPAEGNPVIAPRPESTFIDPPAQLGKDSSTDSFAQFPVFVDTGTSLVDKNNVNDYIAAAAARK